MRKIEKLMLNAVNNNQRFASGNTTVTIDSANNLFVYLFGNCIYKVIDGVKYFTLAGYNTVTTRSRLNALNVDICQRNFTAYYNGVSINSDQWYKIN